MPDSETQRDLEVTEEKSGDEFGDCNTGDQNDIGDIEMANSTNETTSDVEFTHVLIPHPGYDSNGTLVMEESEDCNSSARDKTSTPTRTSYSFLNQRIEMKNISARNAMIMKAKSLRAMKNAKKKKSVPQMI